MAAFDRRRNPAPEISYPPIFDPTSDAGPSRRRAEGSDEIYLKTGLISQANGSAYIESGGASGVKIACSISGPRPKPPPYSAQGTLNVEVKFAPFASHPRRAPLRNTEPVNLSTLLHQLLLPSVLLHLLPKSIVDVYLVVLESDSESDVLAAGLTVASAALADAGIEMKGVTVGSVVSKNGTELLLDATPDERRSAKGSLTIGVMPAVGKVTNLWLTGELDVDEASEMIDKAVTSCKSTHGLVAQALLESAAIDVNV